MRRKHASTVKQTTFGTRWWALQLIVTSTQSSCPISEVRPSLSTISRLDCTLMLVLVVYIRIQVHQSKVEVYLSQSPSPVQ